MRISKFGQNVEQLVCSGLFSVRRDCNLRRLYWWIEVYPMFTLPS